MPTRPIVRLRWAADGPLALLAVLCAAFVAALAAVIARLAPPAVDPLAACASAVASVAARMGTPGGALSIGVLTVVVVALGLAFVHQVWVTRRMLARVLVGQRPSPERLARLAAAAGIGGRLDLVADDAAFTFCYGFLRPRVCLSQGMARLLSDDELAAVLRHEAHHLRHRDPLKILVGRTLASGLFFLPLAGALRNGFLAAKELCADADATAAGDDMALARALFKLLSADRPRWPAGVLAVGALSPTEARLHQLLEPRAIRPILPSTRDWLVSAVLAAAIFGGGIRSADAGGPASVDAACAPPVPVYYGLPSAAPARPSAPTGLVPPAPEALECDALCLGAHAD